MPYLPLDLDAKKLIPKVAACAGTTPGHVLWGLSELWEYVWGSKRDTVSELVLTGCFGPSSTMSAALVEFGFLEAATDGYRVKGAARFLGVRRAQSEGGKKAKSHLKQFAPTTGLLGEEPESPPAPSRVDPGDTSESRPALSPNTQHPTPKLLKAASPESAEPLLLPAEADEPDAADAFQRAWNNQAPPELPRCRTVTPDRRKAIHARLKEHSMSELIEAVCRLNLSDFLCGKGKQGWKADIDWLLRPGNVAKVLEGKYDDARAESSVAAGNAPPCDVPGCGRVSDKELHGKALCGFCEGAWTGWFQANTADPWLRPDHWEPWIVALTALRASA